MKEEFLSYVWKNQYFDKTALKTVQGEVLQIIDPGMLNTNAGPDFSNARIKIGTTVWVGPVEIHVKSSEWQKHYHHHDPTYDQVVLHVVWENNVVIRFQSGKEIPVLELKDKVDQKLLVRQLQLDQSAHFIPCQSQLKRTSPKSFSDMLDIAFSDRIKRKIQTVFTLFITSNNSWEQTAYIVLGKSFGFNINADVFELLVGIVPLSIVRKSRFNLFQLEALYFGQAGLLEKMQGDLYYQRLQAEFQYLKKKYSLRTGTVKRKMWNYLRLRPSNFPSLRIAQFAALMQTDAFLFSAIREATTISDFTKQVVTPSSYWDSHYDFGKTWSIQGSKLGKSSLENLVINTVIPLLACYAYHTGQEAFFKRARDLTRQLLPENNRIISYWKDNGFEVSSAYDSQALIELNKHYCRTRRCLDCTIGQSILTRK